MPFERLRPHEKDLGGGLIVRRSLPSLPRQSVGPFVFFDHFGPVEVRPEDRHDVRPHPHIGLATVSYLFEGAMLHRDSTGAVQRIEPGAINWMTAGRGIVHSERRPADLADRIYRQHGLQLWAALPEADEAMEPGFAHTPAEQIPELDACGARVRVLVGAAHGLCSPVQTRSPTLFVDYRVEARGEIELPEREIGIEQAVYGVDEAFELSLEDGSSTQVEPGEMLVLPEGLAGRLRCGAPSARVVLIGGAPVGKRLMWWNFVARTRETITEAARAWDEDRLGQVPGETERIPLPERRPG